MCIELRFGIFAILKSNSGVMKVLISREILQYYIFFFPKTTSFLNLLLLFGFASEKRVQCTRGGGGSGARVLLPELHVCLLQESFLSP